MILKYDRAKLWYFGCVAISFPTMPNTTTVTISLSRRLYCHTKLPSTAKLQWWIYRHKHKHTEAHECRTHTQRFDGNGHFLAHAVSSIFRRSLAHTHTHTLTGGVPAVVVQSEALWARIPEIQVRIPSRAMGTFFPHTVSSIFRLSLTHTHTQLKQG